MVYAILFASMSMQVLFSAFDCCNYIQICVMCISMSMSIDRILLHRTTTLRATFYILSLSSAQFSWANTRCTHQHMPKILTERIHKPNFKDIDTLVFGLLSSSSSSTEIRQTNLCRPKPDCAICCFPLFHTHIQIQSADQFYLLNHAFSQIKTRTRTQISYLMCIRWNEMDATMKWIVLAWAS